jgi:hypothetical protein
VTVVVVIVVFAGFLQFVDGCFCGVYIELCEEGVEEVD